MLFRGKGFRSRRGGDSGIDSLQNVLKMRWGAEMEVGGANSDWCYFKVQRFAGGVLGLGYQEQTRALSTSCNKVLVCINYPLLLVGINYSLLLLLFRRRGATASFFIVSEANRHIIMVTTLLVTVTDTATQSMRWAATTKPLPSRSARPVGATTKPAMHGMQAAKTVSHRERIDSETMNYHTPPPPCAYGRHRVILCR